MLEAKGIIVLIIAFLLFALGLYSKGENVYVVTSGERRKPLNIIFFVIFVFLWIFGVCVTDSYDIGNYKWAYDEGIAHGKEPLFDVIKFFFHDVGWSFEAFKVVWISFIFILLYIGIKKYSKAPGAVAGLGLITVMTGFITQMRSAMVGAIFLNVFQLILSEKKKDRILYFIIIILSAQIHIIGYVFLIFLILNKKERIDLKRMYYIAILLITLIVLFASGFSASIISEILNFLPFSENNAIRVLTYFQDGGSNLNLIGSCFLIFKHFFLFLLTDKACEMQINETDINNLEIEKYKIIRQANMLMLVFLPITLLAVSFERPFNIFALIQYSMVFNVGEAKFVIFRRNLLNISLQVLMIAGVMFFTLINWYSNPEDLIRIINSLKWVF